MLRGVISGSFSEEGRKGEEGGGAEEGDANLRGTKYAPPVPWLTHCCMRRSSASPKSVQRDLLLE